MANTVDFISYNDVFMANGTQQWSWPVGDATTFQSFNVKPQQFNCTRCGITELYFTRGNGPGNGLGVEITVDLDYGLGSTGGLLVFYAIGAPSQ